MPKRKNMKKTRKTEERIVYDAGYEILSVMENAAHVLYPKVMTTADWNSFVNKVLKFVERESEVL